MQKSPATPTPDKNSPLKNEQKLVGVSPAVSQPDVNAKKAGTPSQQLLVPTVKSSYADNLKVQAAFVAKPLQPQISAQDLHRVPSSTNQTLPTTPTSNKMGPAETPGKSSRRPIPTSSRNNISTEEQTPAFTPGTSNRDLLRIIRHRPGNVVALKEEFLSQENKDLPSLDFVRKAAAATRFIKGSILKNSCDSRLDYIASEEEESHMAANVESEEKFDNYGESCLNMDPQSPPHVTPPVRSTKLIHRSHYRSLKEEVSYKGMNHWQNIFSVVLAVQSYLELPLFAWNNGGYFFIFPVLIVQLLVVFPVFLLELSLGQFTGEGPIEIFSTMAPLLKGFSLLFTIARLSRALLTRSFPYEMMILLDRFSFLLVGKMRRTCSETANYCHMESNCPSGEIVDGVCIQAYKGTPQSHYVVAWGRAVAALNTTTIAVDTLSEDYYNSMIFACLFLSGIIYFFSSMSMERRARHSFVHFVMCIISTLLFLVFFYLEEDSLRFGMPGSDAEKLLDPWVWVSAFQWACELMSIGDGTVHTLGSMLPFHFSAFHATVISASINVLLMCLSFVVVVPYLNSSKFNPTSDDISSARRFFSAIRRSEEAWPNTSLPKYSLLLHITFTLFQLGYVGVCIDTLTHRVEVKLTKMTSGFFALIPPMRRYAVKMAALLVIAMLQFQVQVNYQMASYFYRHVASIIIPSIIFYECLIVGQLYGMRRYIVNMQTMYGEVSRYWLTYGMFKFFIRFVVPICCLIFVFIHAHSISSVIDIHSIIYVISAFLSVIMVMQLVTKYFTNGLPFVYLLQTEQSWGPQNLLNRRKAIFDERAARLF